MLEAMLPTRRQVVGQLWFEFVFLCKLVSYTLHTYDPEPLQKSCTKHDQQQVAEGTARWYVVICFPLFCGA